MPVKYGRNGREKRNILRATKGIKIVNEAVKISVYITFGNYMS
jgi:hypothetical protein